MAVRVDLLGPQIVHDLDRAFAEDVLLEDVRQACLGIHREDEDLLALLGEPERCRGGERRLAQPALAAEHHVAALRMAGQLLCEPGHTAHAWIGARRGVGAHAQNIASVRSFSRSIRRFHVEIWGTTYGSRRSE